jgi:hypothetical protein
MMIVMTAMATIISTSVNARADRLSRAIDIGQIPIEVGDGVGVGGPVVGVGLGVGGGVGEPPGVGVPAGVGVGVGYGGGVLELGDS